MKNLVKREQRQVFELMLSSLRNNGIIPIIIVDSNSITVEGGDEKRIFDLEPQVDFEYENEKVRFIFYNLMYNKESIIKFLQIWEEEYLEKGYSHSEMLFNIEQQGNELIISLKTKYGTARKERFSFYYETNPCFPKALNLKIEEYNAF